MLRSAPASERARERRGVAYFSVLMFTSVAAPEIAMVGCGGDDAAASGATTTDDPATTSGETPATRSTDEPPIATSTGVVEPLTDGGQVDGSSGGDTLGAECSMYDQDCAEGDKCVPWSDLPDLVPDDIRCCPIVGTPKEVGDACQVEDYFGSCLDDCSVGSFCMDLDGDGEGVCQAMCTGSAANPRCEADESCLIYFAGVPLCFDECDPLIQDCPEGDGCYPDEASAGGTGFICLPTVTVTSGGFGSFCWLLSGCQPGFLCVASDFLPSCTGIVGCCSPLCDITEPDTCSDFDPDIECVPWYYGGEAPPSAGLMDVGACALPPD